MTKTLPWFRLYSEILDDRKIKRICRTTTLSKAMVLGTWVILLAIASESANRGRLEITKGTPLNLQDLAEETGLDETTLKAILDLMNDLEMIQETSGTYEITNWESRQFLSDSSTERVRKHRERTKQEDETLQKRYRNESGTPPDTDTDTETESDTEIELISAAQSEKSPQNQEGSIYAGSVPAIGTTGDELDEYIQVYETAMGERVLPYPGLVLLVNEMKKEGVTPEIYRNALLGLKANGYTVSNMMSAKKWAIKDAREKANPKPLPTRARKNGDGLYLQSMSAKWNEKPRNEKIESLEYMRANGRLSAEAEAEGIALKLIKELPQETK